LERRWVGESGLGGAVKTDVIVSNRRLAPWLRKPNKKTKEEEQETRKKQEEHFSPHSDEVWLGGRSSRPRFIQTGVPLPPGFFYLKLPTQRFKRKSRGLLIRYVSDTLSKVKERASPG
jgi:hypothetical protein